MSSRNFKEILFDDPNEGAAAAAPGYRMKNSLSNPNHNTESYLNNNNNNNNHPNNTFQQMEFEHTIPLPSQTFQQHQLNETRKTFTQKQERFSPFPAQSTEGEYDSLIPIKKQMRARVNSASLSNKSENVFNTTTPVVVVPAFVNESSRQRLEWVSQPHLPIPLDSKKQQRRQQLLQSSPDEQIRNNYDRSYSNNENGMHNHEFLKSDFEEQNGIEVYPIDDEQDEFVKPSMPSSAQSSISENQKMKLKEKYSHFLNGADNIGASPPNLQTSTNGLGRRNSHEYHSSHPVGRPLNLQDLVAAPAGMENSFEKSDGNNKQNVLKKGLREIDGNATNYQWQQMQQELQKQQQQQKQKTYLGNERKQNEDQVKNIQTMTTSPLGMFKEPRISERIDQMSRNLKSVDTYKISLHSIHTNMTSIESNPSKKKSPSSQEFESMQLQKFQQKSQALNDVLGRQQQQNKQGNNAYIPPASSNSSVPEGSRSRNSRTSSFTMNQQQDMNNVNSGNSIQQSSSALAAKRSSSLSGSSQQLQQQQQNPKQSIVSQEESEQQKRIRYHRESNEQQQQKQQPHQHAGLQKYLQSAYPSKREIDGMKSNNRREGYYDGEDDGEMKENINSINRMQQPDQSRGGKKSGRREEKESKVGREEFELQRIKFYDTFMPRDMKMMKSPYHLLKYKMSGKAQFNISNCISDLATINHSLNASFNSNSNSLNRSLYR